MPSPIRRVVSHGLPAQVDRRSLELSGPFYRQPKINIYQHDDDDDDHERERRQLLPLSSLPAVELTPPTCGNVPPSEQILLVVVQHQHMMLAN